MRRRCASEVINSSDHGLHFGPPVVLGSGAYSLAPTPDLSLPTGPSVAIDRLNIGSAGAGAVFFQPQVTVDAAGTADVMSFALAHGRVNVLLAHSTAYGMRFHFQRITPTPFDAALST